MSKARFDGGLNPGGLASDPLTAKAGDIYYNTVSNKHRMYNGTTWMDVGSGSGGINYITFNDAESGTNGWATYADAAGVVPVDGTGGSPNVTWTTSSSAPLRGSNSYLLTKDAANRQGQGVSYNFTIDAADKGKVLQGSFDYAISSGTYADDDVQIYIYDVTNSAVIYAAPYLLKNHLLTSDKFGFEFQTNSSSTSYRLILHIASTSALAYTLKFDNFAVGPNAKLFGSPVTDWLQYTPTLNTGARNGSPNWDKAFWRRVGSDMEIVWNYRHSSAGTAGSGDYTFTIPSGYTIDTTKINVTGSGGGVAPVCGTFNHNYSSNQGSGIAVVMSSTTIGAYTDIDANNSAVMWNQANTGSFGATSLTFSFAVKVPITGWNSQVAMSKDSATRDVAFIALPQVATGTISAAYNIAKLATVNKDTHAGYNTTTGQYTVPVSGYYDVSAAVDITGTYTIGQTIGLRVGNDTTAEYVYGFIRAYGSITTDLCANAAGGVYARAGDIISVSSFAQGSSLSYSASLSGNYLYIARRAGPAQIAASEVLAPTIQKFTSGSGTYNLPTSVRRPLYIRVRMIGGGGGGGGSHNGTPGAVANGGTGGNTTFGSSLLVANGGAGGAKDASGVSVGGTASLGTGPIGTAVQGGNGHVCGVGNTTTIGGQGAASPFANGAAGGANTAGTAAIANTGSGGGGGGNPGTASSVYGGGGAAGGYVDAIISNPSNTYAYAVGGGGAVGTAGTGGFAGGTGGSGYIEVTEYYQ